MEKIIIINTKQFGYHIDSYKYAKYLKKKWDVTYICFDTGHKKIIEQDVNVIYIDWIGSFIRKLFTFIIKSIKLIKNNNPNIVFIVHFEFCSFIKLFAKSKYILDIRTGKITKNKIIEYLSNFIIKIDSIFFNNLTIISDGLAKKLKIKKYKLLPLGADIISNENKNFENLNLFYIGTLSLRNIDKTIVGFKQFIDKHKIDSIKYYIFGDGTDFEKNKLISAIHKNKLKENVFYMGYKTHDEIKKYFDLCNVGISFVPINKLFNVQPPTKTFEYILSGMVCIATKTIENQKCINDYNGVLCMDNSDSFCNALEKIYNNRAKYNSLDIKETLLDYKWENIIENNLGIYLNKINNG